MQQKVLALPGRDHLHELVVLDLLHLGVDGHELGPEDLAEVGFAAQRLERLAEAARQRVIAEIGVAPALRSGLERCWMPSQPQASVAAIAMYGLASAPIMRFSTRRAAGAATGARIPTVRLSVPHWMLIGAAVKRVRRR